MTADLPGGEAPPPPIARPTAASTMRRDIASAYIAAASKIGSWVVVSAAVYRFLGPPEFALLALIRGTIGLLNYISLGLAPALIHEASHVTAALQVEPNRQTAGNENVSYRSPQPNVRLRALYSNALVIASVTCIVGAIVAGSFATSFQRVFRVPTFIPQLPIVVWYMGFGTLLRLVGDAPGAVLQVGGKIALDNVIVAGADVVWAAFAAMTCFGLGFYGGGLHAIAAWYALSGGFSFLVRHTVASVETGIPGPRIALLNRHILRRLLSYGAMVVLAQLADYLYAPTDYILINRLLDPVDVANYAPAVQLDSGLLLLVTGLSAVMLPKAALAHAAGDATTVRRYYVVATVSSFVLLATASIAVWLLSPWIFRLWLGNPMPVTRSILPLVLINTIIGGSSAIGRSILLAVGRVRPFTISVLIAGVTNVACSYAFVRWFHWGLRGIVLGTVVAVVGRCMIWMPWYVLRTLRGLPVPPAEAVELPVPPPV